MKRSFTYYNRKEVKDFSEEECRSVLGEKQFDSMMKEAINALNHKESYLHMFDKDSPYADWYIEEVTGLKHHKIGVCVFTLIICIIMAVVHLFTIPTPWVSSLFALPGYAFLISGTILLLFAYCHCNPRTQSVGGPMFFLGLLMLSFQKLLIVL